MSVTPEAAPRTPEQVLSGDAPAPQPEKRALAIILANPRGFCAGVDRAISIVERALELFVALLVMHLALFLHLQHVLHLNHL